MKNIYITILAFTFALTSCEFDEGFEDMNVNPNAANQVAVANKFAKTMLDTSGGRYENWRNSLIYNSTLIQHYSTTAVSHEILQHILSHVCGTSSPKTEHTMTR